MIQMRFDQKGDFAANYAAEKWCEDNDISFGLMCRDLPRGLMHGDYNIAKWRNLSAREIKSLHGRMTGDMRNGPVFIEICEPKDAIK